MADRIPTSRWASALDTIEEATRLLRSAPAGILLAYYIGSVPCILGLLYYWTEMSRGPFAAARLAEASLGCALLFIWMKCWHAAFNSGLRATLSLEPQSHWSPGRILRLAAVQAALQPTGLFVRIVAAQILVPYLWVYGFYQSAGVLGDGTRSLREVVRESWAQARLWPGEAHYALGTLFGFALIVWLNVCVITALAPELLRMFFGIETVFTQTPLALLNSTVIAATIGVTYLCFDPLRKALYVVRCFHGGALQSGEDLKVQLRRLQKPLRRAAVAATLLLYSAAPFTISAQESGPPSSARVDAVTLDRSIADVLERREFAWRAPKEIHPAEEKGWLTLFMEDIADRVRSAIKGSARSIRDFFRWLGRMFFRDRLADESSSGGFWNFANAAQPLLYAIIALSVAAVAFLLWKRRRLLRIRPATAEAVVPVPDLRSDNVVADQLPEDGWLQLARELIEAGELRLALRAAYLAGLAHLGQRNLITIARHKSDRDYDRELRRRARARDELIAAFEENLRVFERAWYGLHEVTRETLGSFQQNLERIRGC